MVKYVGEKDYEHGTKESVGILITNLGTPDAPDKKELKVYLNQFLSDPRVIELPKILWQILLKLVILQIRPAKSAEAYKKIWTKNGSPLLDISKRQLEKIKLWSQAIKKKASLVNLTNSAFYELAENERNKVLLWARATKEFHKSLSDFLDLKEYHVQACNRCIEGYIFQ